MTVISDVGAAAPPPIPAADSRPADHRGSFIPNVAMITTRLMELRKRRGLMIALILVNIGIPTIFLAFRLVAHAIAPKTYGAAGGYSVYTNLAAGVMYIFGFIVAAALGATAGSSDLTDGTFRHLVVTGRSRLSLYLARIPAGLAIVVPVVASGFAIVCAVCVFAAPTSTQYDGSSVPLGLSRAGLESWAADHTTQVICDFPYNEPINVAVPCGNGPGPGGGGPGGGGVRVFKGSGGPSPAAPPADTPAQLKSLSVQIANQAYSDYANTFLYPSTWLMIDTGLWLELVAIVGFMVGLGLGSLMGQRTVPVILLVVLEVILAGPLSTHVIPYFQNVQRGVFGLALLHLEPSGLPLALIGGGGGGGPGGGRNLLPESTAVAALVVAAWIVGWSILGAWRMMTRDA